MTARQTKISSQKLIKPLPAVSIVGVGNCGTALAWAMHSVGIKVAELVVHRTTTAQQKQLTQGCGARLVRFADWTYSDAQCCWLCVPDDSLVAVATEIGQRMDPGAPHLDSAMWVQRARLTFLHTSGARSYRDLAPLKRKGIAIGAAHPFRSFPQPQRVSLDGTYFAVEGETAAQRAATAIIEKIGGVPFELRTQNKATYHAFGAFASPLLVSLLASATAVGVRAGIPADAVAQMLGSLAGGTFANWQQHGAAPSFSGPIARGDIETIARHLASLSTVPELDKIYRALASYAAIHLPAKRRAELRNLLAAKAGPA